MKIGIFDSGLGGLIAAKAVRGTLPQYDYVYFGDTKRIPYGNRSHEAVFEFTKQAVDYLFRKEKCGLIILACNTASARTLRRIQREYLPKHFPDRKVLGVLIPAAEVAVVYDRVGILATAGTVASDTFPKEIKKLNRKVTVIQNAAPMLVPLIEEGDTVLAKPFITKYVSPLLRKKIQALVLGCTHYIILKKEIRQALPKGVKIISQDEIIPNKLQAYLERHPEIEQKLSKKRTVKLLVTDKTQNLARLVKNWFGKAKVGVIKDSVLV